MNDKEILYKLQNDVLKKLQLIKDPQIESAKLCGGTALARCYLDHRISYDLDFFLPNGFSANKLLGAVGKVKLLIKTKNSLKKD